MEVYTSLKYYKAAETTRNNDLLLFWMNTVVILSLNSRKFVEKYLHCEFIVLSFVKTSYGKKSQRSFWKKIYLHNTWGLWSTAILKAQNCGHCEGKLFCTGVSGDRQIDFVLVRKNDLFIELYRFRQNIYISKSVTYPIGPDMRNAQKQHTFVLWHNKMILQLQCWCQ